VTLHALIQLYIDTKWPADQRINCKAYVENSHLLKAFMFITDDYNVEELLFDQAVDLVQVFVEYRQLKGLAASSIDNGRRALSAFFTWSGRKRLLPFGGNPAHRKNINMPALVTRCRRPVGQLDLVRLLALARETSIYPHILLCIAVGLRRVGASRVRSEHIDLEERTLIVFEKRRERIVPLSEWFVRELKAYLERQPWQYFHPDTIGHRFQELRDAAGLPSHVTLQALRRTFLKKLFDAGVAPQLAASLAGNSIEVIQKHYVELETLNARSVVDVIRFD